jgi:hypothetical protein
MLHALMHCDPRMKHLDVLIEVPCFKCLFSEPIRVSHLHCDPNQCEKLTEWLEREIKLQKTAKKTVTFIPIPVEKARE